MKRDQFGRDLRKIAEGFISSDTIRDLHYQFMDDSNTTDESVKQFIKRVGDAYGIELKEKQYPKPVEIGRFSKKGQKIETSYKKMLAEKRGQTHGRVICDGCGTCTGYIDPSHIVPRSVRKDLIDDPENVEWHCRERCHPACEAGRYSDLKNCEKIIDFLKRKAPDFLRAQLNRKTA